MTQVKSLSRGWGLLVVLVLALPAQAGEVPSFKKKSELEKKFVSEVCVAILDAAHFSGKDQAMEEHKFKEVKPGRTELRIRGSYKGAVTRKKYIADIVIHLDTLNKDSWEVLRIEYSDNNNVPYSRKKVDALIEKFNKK